LLSYMIGRVNQLTHIFYSYLTPQIRFCNLNPSEFGHQLSTS
jgi:hypothetical protein